MATRPVPLHWAALLSAVEQDPGHWHLNVDPETPPYACVRLVDVTRDGTPLRVYRVVTWAPTSADRRLVGYFPTLREACERGRAHHAHVGRYGDDWMIRAAEQTAYGRGGR